MEVNAHRIIKMNKTGQSDVTWRNALSTILSNSSDTSFPNFYGDFDVDPDIDLLMTHQESVKTKNKYTGAVESLTQTLDSLTGNAITNMSKLTQVVSKGGKLAIGLGSSIAGGSDGTGALWNPWFKNIQAWEGVEGGISFDYSFEFSMGQYGIWNAFEEVFKPVLNLVSIALPRNVGIATASGPYPTAIDLVQNVFQRLVDGKMIDVTEEDSIETRVSSTFSLESFANVLSNIFKSAYADFTYDISFGSQIEFYSMMVEQSSYEFSAETDQYGYPIWGKATLSLRGIIPAAVTSQAGSRAVRYGIKGE